MENQLSNNTYACRCCNKYFNSSKQRATHESGMRRLGKGPDKKR
jgi:hypothetical protein